MPRTTTGTVEMTINRKRIGRASFRIASGEQIATVSIRLTKSTRSKLRRRDKLKPLVRITLVERRKAVRTELARATIRPPKKS